MARELKLDIHAVDKATRDRMTMQYKRLGLDLVWCEIDGNTNRVSVAPSKRPPKVWTVARRVPNSTCISCEETKPRGEFDLTANNRPMNACRACSSAPIRKCRKCGETKDRNEFYQQTGWVCIPCKQQSKIDYRERMKR